MVGRRARRRDGARDVARDAVVELRDVSKAFASQPVLNGLGLSVARGEVFGFLGRNGAGKSTAIRILMGITRADYGRVRVFGQPLSENLVEVRRRIGYVAQEQNVYPWMTPQVLGKFVRGFYPRWDRALWTRLNADFGLPPKKRIGTFSGGMKAKLALSLALATRPDLLILDEPTAGMDPVARREFIDLVREHTARDGATTFFSTHLIDEIEVLADRIGIVEGGRTVYEGRLAPLREGLARFSIARADDVPGSLPGAFAQERLRVLEDRERQGRRYLTLQFGGPRSRRGGARARARLATRADDARGRLHRRRRRSRRGERPRRGEPRRVRGLLSLLGKDAREHAPTALVLGVATLAVVLVALAQNRVAAFSMSPFEVVRFALLSYVPLVALIVGNRLVVREYLAGTRAFVEALPIGRWLPLALKYALGLAYLASLTLALVLLAARAAGVADDVTGDYVALMVAKSLALVALYWSVVFCFSLCGHLRVALYLVLIGAVLGIAFWPGIDQSRFAPFALLDGQLFVFERELVPWPEIGGTLLLAAAFAVAGFVLSRIGEGSLAERLARPMTRRDFVALAVLGIGGLVVAGTLIERAERVDFSFTSELTLRSTAPAVSVLYGEAEHRGAGEAMLARTADSLEGLQAALGRSALPVARVALAPELEPHDIDYSTLDGVFVRASWLEHEPYDDAVLDAVIVHGVLGILSGERAMFEPYHWVLDGISRWWAEQGHARHAAAHQAELLARAAHVLRRGGALDLVDDWQPLADRFAYPGAEALAWSAVRYLELERGREAVLTLARAYFGVPVGGDTRAAIEDRRRAPGQRFADATGLDWRDFVAGWRAWLAARADDPAVRALLGSVPPIAGTLRAGVDEEGVYRLVGGYRSFAGADIDVDAALADALAAAPGTRCVMKHDRLGPFDDEFDVDQGDDERTRHVAGCRLGDAVHEVGSRYAAGTRVYVAFDLEDGAFHQPLRLDALRANLAAAPLASPAAVLTPPAARATANLPGATGGEAGGETDARGANAAMRREGAS